MNKISILVNNELFYAKDIISKNHFSYIDNADCVNDVDINDKQIVIKRIDKDHSTILTISDKSDCKIKTNEGTLIFELKDVAINRNFDIISIVYTINEEKKTIEIRYLGDK